MIIRIEVPTQREVDQVLDALRHLFWARVQLVAVNMDSMDVYVAPLELTDQQQQVLKEVSDAQS